MKNKIDSKLEKIIEDMIDLMAEAVMDTSYEGHYYDMAEKEAINKIKHLILSEIKKVEPDTKKTPYQALEFADECIECGYKFNKDWTDDKLKEVRTQAISEYHKALEELLK